MTVNLNNYVPPPNALLRRGHDVCVAWDEESAGAVAMEALVRARLRAEQGGRSWLGDGTFVVAAEGRRVIGPILDSAVGQVEVGAHCTQLSLP